ncbi:MAG: TonB family protein, partial [Myxococcota bacterium]
LEQTPERARFSGRTSTRAERDVMKYGTDGSENPSATPRRRVETTPGLRPAEAPRRRSREAQREANSDSTLTPELEREPKEAAERATERAEDLEVPFAEPDIILPSAARKRAARAAEESGQDRSRDGLARGEFNAKDLFPSASAAASTSTEFGNDGTFHFMKDVAEGDRTMLNRKRNRYWTFYDRMQRQLKREWSPRRELRKRDPFGTVYGVGTFYTVVDMTLNADGSIRKLDLARSCGLPFLDDEAIRALHAAGPFPNPPEGMKDSSGLIHIKFGFALEVVSGRVRFLRARPEKMF